MADAEVADSGTARLVRVTLPGQAGLPEPDFVPDSLVVVELEVENTEAVSAIVEDEVAKAAATAGCTVLDLPGECLVNPNLTDRIEVPVVVVGPTSFDEHAAIRLLALLMGAPPSEPTSAGCPWLLGYGRSGDGAAQLFQQTMVRLADVMAVPIVPRVFPVVLPLFSRAETTRIVAGYRNLRTVSASLGLLAALRLASRNPDSAVVEPNHFAEVLDEGVRSELKEREQGVGETLRELADALDDINDDRAPTHRQLKGVPCIEDWKASTRKVRVLTGRVYGHPAIKDGRRIVTSDLYASDLANWARTFSRYYRLGTPAADPASPNPQ